jgi:U3 small nucleolar RNA-associated protein 13
LQGVQAEPISAFIMHPVQPNLLVTCSRNLQVRVWDTTTGEAVRAWRGHRLPVLVTDFDRSGTLLATGSADRSVMVWDVDHGHATHSFKGHEGVVTALRFAPHPVSVQRLVSGAEDGSLRVWDLVTQACVAAIKEHFSAVTSILFSPDAHGHHMVTAGRDRVLMVWDTREFDTAAVARGATATSASGSAALKLTVPVQEGIEAAVALPAEAAQTAAATVTGGAGAASVATAAAAAATKELVFVTAGDRGMLRKWRVTVAGATRADRKYTCACVASRTVPQLRGGRDAGGPALKPAASANDGSVADEDWPVSQQYAALMLRKQPSGLTAVACDDGADGAQGQRLGGKRKRPAAEDGLAAESAGGASKYELLAVTRDHVLTLVGAEALAPRKTIAGYNDEVIDVKYIPPPLAAHVAQNEAMGLGVHASAREPLVAVATNSEQLRIVNRDTFDTRLCDGHTDIVLCVAASPDGALVATASKDRTARVWDVATGVCVAECEGHMEAVTAVTWPSRAAQFIRAAPRPQGAAAAPGGAAAGGATGTAGWLITGSKDRTLKAWQLGEMLGRLPSPRPADWAAPALRERIKGVGAPRTTAAVVAHEKDVNALAVAPNDRLLATGSQDKTIKLWSAPDLVPLATLRGHKRGVWALAFSPVDQILASASGDRTIRLWSVARDAGYACLRTLEGHDASVLAVRFLRRGTQLLSGGADGLVKLWSVRDTECVNTFDAHTDKVWALAVRAPEDQAVGGDAGGAGGAGVDGAAAEVEMMTGGGDSVLNVWRDVTSEEAHEEVAAAEAAMLKQQALFNAMSGRHYQRAIGLTLELDQPGRCGDIMAELLEVGPTPPTAGVSPDIIDARYRDQMLAELADMQAEERGIAPAAAAVPWYAAHGAAGASAAVSVTGSREGEAKLVSVLRALPRRQMIKLLGYIREWNTQSRHGLLAQHLLYLLLRRLPRGTLLRCFAEGRRRDDEVSRVLSGVGTVTTRKPQGALALADELTPVAHPVTAAEGDEVAAAAVAAAAGNDGLGGGSDPMTAAAAQLKAFVAAVLPYSERHLDRLDRLTVSSYAVDYTLASMHVLEPEAVDIHAGGGGAADGRAHVASAWRDADDSASSDEEGDALMRGAAGRRGCGWLLAPAAPTVAPASGAAAAAAGKQAGKSAAPAAAATAAGGKPPVAPSAGGKKAAAAAKVAAAKAGSGSASKAVAAAAPAAPAASARCIIAAVMAEGSGDDYSGSDSSHSSEGEDNAIAPRAVRSGRAAAAEPAAEKGKAKLAVSSAGGDSNTLSQRGGTKPAAARYFIGGDDNDASADSDAGEAPFTARSSSQGVSAGGGSSSAAMAASAASGVRRSTRSRTLSDLDRLGGMIALPPAPAPTAGPATTSQGSDAEKRGHKAGQRTGKGAAGGRAGRTGGKQ